MTSTQARPQVDCHIPIGAFLLVSILLVAPLLHAQVSQSAPEQGTTLSTAAPDHPVDANGPPSMPGPEKHPYFFLRLFAVLGSGLLITAAHLARKFRRFWGLGIFANPYGLLYLAVGAAISGIPVASEIQPGWARLTGPAGPWVLDFSGILVTLILPMIRLRSASRPSEDAQPLGFEAASANPIVALIEDGIREHILKRLRVEINAVSSEYDWETIRLAATRALIEETTIRPIDPAKEKEARRAIEGFQPDPNPQLDLRKKYEALFGMLRWCSFHRLKGALKSATQADQAAAPIRTRVDSRQPAARPAANLVPAAAPPPPSAAPADAPPETLEPDRDRDEARPSTPRRRLLAIATLAAATAAGLLWIGISAYRSHLAVDHFNRAHDLLAKGNNEAAAAEYRRALDLKSNYADAYRGLGITFYNQRNYNAAIQEYRKAILLDPKSVRAHRDLGLALSGAGDYPASIAEFQTAVSLAPQNSDAHENLADAFYDEGNLDAAIAEYRKTISLNPSNANAHFNLGNALGHERDYGAAAAEYRKVIALNPKYSPAHALLGTFLSLVGKHDAGQVELRRAISLDSNDYFSHLQLALSLVAEKHYQPAVGEFQRAVDLAPDDPLGHSSFGKMLYEMGDYDRAITELQKAISLDSEDAETHYDLGLALMRARKDDAAITQFQEVISLNPKNPNDSSAYNDLGVIMLRKKNQEAAFQDFQTAVSFDSKNAEAHNNLGLAYENRGDHAEAIAEFREAIKIQPDFTTARNNLSRVLRKSGGR
jgi:tetratricopeptide (TPR) repeat protein